MKKTIRKITLFTFALGTSVLLISQASNAQVLSTQAGGAGTTVTLAEDAGSGPGITFPPSPGVVLAVSSSANAFAITAMNVSSANGDRNEYGVWSGNTGYYQRVNPNSAASTPVLTDLSVDLTNTTVLTATPFGGTTWINMGGGGS